MGLLGFLTKKKFYIHLGISVLVSLALLLLVLGMLKSYTHHGEAYIIPDLTGLTPEQIGRDEAGDLFRLIITDSIYDNDLVPGSVFRQNPSPGSKAKKGRTIYLTTVSFTQEYCVMPELKDLTVRQAVTTLKTQGLKARRLIYVPHFAENAVLGHYLDGDTLRAGTEILKGSNIDLVVGQGRNQPARVPFVIGLTLEQARDVLHMSSFNVGAEHFLEEPNLLHSRVYRQHPTFQTELPPGEAITLYLRSDLYFNFDSLKTIINPDTAVFLEPIDLNENLEDYETE